MKVTGSNLSRTLGITRANVTQLTHSGVFRKAADGKYDLMLNRVAWQEHEQNKQQGHKVTTAAGVIRARLLQEKFRREKVRADREEGMVILKAEVIRETSRGFSEVRSKMLGLPSELAPLLHGMQPPQAEKLIRERVLKVLKGLSDNEWIKKTEIVNDGKGNPIAEVKLP